MAQADPEMIQEALDRLAEEQEAFQQNLDRSSCSCLEGNPCVQPDRCGDWKNRFTVAMNARRRKGMVVGYDAT